MRSSITTVDTGVLVALTNADDDAHEACREWLEYTPSTLIIPAPLVAEACYVLESRSGVETEAAFLHSLGTEDTFEIFSLKKSDYVRMAMLVRAYRDLPLGGSDAAVIAFTERFNTDAVATLEHRHFRVVKPNHVAHLQLLP